MAAPVPLRPVPPRPTPARAAPARPPRAGTDSSRPGLWSDIALALVLVTLAAVVLNGGVYWLVIEAGERERRVELARATARTLKAQLEAAPVADRERAWSRALRSYRDAGLPLTELWVVDRTLKPIAVVAGTPPDRADQDLRVALIGRAEQLQGDRLWDPSHDGSIVVTEPIAHGGTVAGALRVGMEIGPAGLPGGRLGFLLGYTLVSGLLIGAFGRALFRRRLVDPILALRQATERIANGDFGHTVQVDASRELVGLADALTVLSVSLARYRQATADQVGNLEVANARLREVREELIRSEKLASVGRLAAGIAHEVGNPLAAVSGYVDLLQQDLGDPELERDLYRRMETELRRIRRIITNLLDYARPGASARLPTRPAGILAEALATVRHLPAAREVTLRVEASDDLPEITVEADKLHQVLVNLLMNAFDALGGAGSVTLAAGVDGEQVWLACRDDGPGFPPDDLANVFDPFFTTKAPGAGTGLGLAICQRIVESQGGQIQASNRPEGGAEVRVTLPTAP